MQVGGGGGVCKVMVHVCVDLAFYFFYTIRGYWSRNRGDWPALILCIISISNATLNGWETPYTHCQLPLVAVI